MTAYRKRATLREFCRAVIEYDRAEQAICVAREGALNVAVMEEVSGRLQTLRMALLWRAMAARNVEWFRRRVSG